MRMKQLIPVAALALVSSVALAGLVIDNPVTVTLNPDGSGEATGTLSSARFSKNKVEFVGCGLRRVEDGGGGIFLFGFCQAATATDVQGFCETENPDLIQAIADQDDYSFVVFSWTADGVCRGIGNSTQSFYIPK